MNFVTTRQSLSKLNFALAAPKFFYLFDYLDILPFLQELKEFRFAGFCHDSAMFKQAYIALAVPKFRFAGFCHDSAMFKQAYIALAVPESLEYLR